MICPNCHREINDDSLFCPYCGIQIKSMKKICPTCGQENEADALYCRFCGRPFDLSSRPQDNTPHKEAKYTGYVPLETGMPRQNSEVHSSVQNDYEAEKVDTKVNLKAVICGVLALVLITGGSYYYLRHSTPLKITNRPSESESSTTTQSATFKPAKLTTAEKYSNLSYNGTLACDGTNVFLTNDQGYLVRTDMNFKNAKVLVKESVNYINIYKKTIYFTDADHHLCMTMADGGKKITLINSACYYVTLKGDTIYYQLDKDSESLYAYGIKTKKSTKLIDKHVYNVFVDGSMLYCNTKEGIYSYNLKTAKLTQLYAGTKTDNAQYRDGYVYFIDHGALMRVDVKTKKSEVILSASGDSSFQMTLNIVGYAMSDQAIYFYNYSTYQSGAIYRLDLKTKQIKAVMEGVQLSGTDFQVINDNLLVKVNNQWYAVNTSTKKTVALFNKE